MGDMADYYRDSEFEQQISQDRSEIVPTFGYNQEWNRWQSNTWKTKDGALIKLDQLSDNHIINIISLIESEGINLHIPIQWLKKLRKELNSKSRAKRNERCKSQRKEFIEKYFNNQLIVSESDNFNVVTIQLNCAHEHIVSIEFRRDIKTSGWTTFETSTQYVERKPTTSNVFRSHRTFQDIITLIKK